MRNRFKILSSKSKFGNGGRINELTVQVANNPSKLSLKAAKTASLRDNQFVLSTFELTANDPEISAVTDAEDVKPVTSTSNVDAEGHGRVPAAPDILRRLAAEGITIFPNDQNATKLENQ